MQMKHILTVLLLLALGSTVTVLRAQNSRELLARANQQYVLYENAKGDNSTEMYDHLYQATPSTQVCWMHLPIPMPWKRPETD